MLFDSMMTFCVVAENLADARHGFGEMALLGANPPGVIGSGDQEARSVGFAGAVFFFRDGPGMIGGRTIAGFAIGGADAVSVLRDFEGGPVVGGQGGD